MGSWHCHGLVTTSHGHDLPDDTNLFFFATDSSKCILFFKDLWEPQPISFMAFPAQKYGAENFFFAAYYVHQEEMSCWLIIHICDLSLTLVISSLPEGHKKGFSVVFLPLPP